MAPVTTQQHKYLHLANDEDETSSFIHDSEKIATQYDSRNKNPRSRLWTLLPWLLHLIFLFAYTATFVNLKRPVEVTEGFNSPSDAPIEYETVKFHSNLEDDMTEFQGPSNPQTDAAWEKLLDVGPGLIWIDDQTAQKLPMNTTKRINGEGYAGVVEMFHQLHCLDRIRVQFYNRTRNDENETQKIFKSHTEHCFDYLRQTLMCHGDLNIMSMNWEAEQQFYTAQFDVVKQCRNFDKIKDWTKEHQTGWWPPHSPA